MGRGRREEEEFNYWPSFVDVMSTMALVFAFIMIIFSSVVYVKYSGLKTTYDKFDNIGRDRALLYEKIESELKPKLGENINFDKEKGSFNIRSEVLFAVDSFELTDAGKDIAKTFGDVFIEFLSEGEYKNKIKYIEVVGHTDLDGSAEYNRFLSTNRAASFSNSMVDESRCDRKLLKHFKSSGMSKFEPNRGSVSDQTEDDKSKNRRIEINIVFDDSDIQESISTFFKK